MNYDALVSGIEQFGYAALFLFLWLGIVGMPIPDEVVVLTGGALTSSGLLHVVPAFLLTYLGVISGLSLGYGLGRFLGAKVLLKLRRKKKMGRYIYFAERLGEKYGSYALCISYFFPIIRHLMPYLVGLQKMSFRRYALFSYTTGFVWTLAYFIVGRFVGNHVQEVGELVYNYGIRLLWIPLVVMVIFVVRYWYQRQKFQQGGSNG
ncbi:DedA family protein [Paenibacillus sp. KN14-4R]|uniref:DedA family protein n=1 Tax=Paenibacillus sp. KN14-4R TaxID=3445773 RepID=UPI003F9FE8EE